jgi:hypothetical protein
MTGQYPKACNLEWHELLTADEIRNWLSTGVVPKRLSAEFDCPGIYRFVFAEFRDENGAHTACYVGETTNLCRRIQDYFPKKNQAGTNQQLSPGWEARGRVLLSMEGLPTVDFKIETLEIVGHVNFGGFTFGPETFADAHGNFFLRRMLESWAILASEYADDLYPLNRRGTKVKPIFQDLAKKYKKQLAKKAKQKTSTSIP